MEKPESLASVSGLSAESPGGVSKAVPGGVKGTQTDSGPPSGVALFCGAGPLLHTGGTVPRRPGPIQPSEWAMTLSSRPSAHLREVLALELGQTGRPSQVRGRLKCTARRAVRSPGQLSCTLKTLRNGRGAS